MGNFSCRHFESASNYFSFSFPFLASLKTLQPTKNYFSVSNLFPFKVFFTENLNGKVSPHFPFTRCDNFPRLSYNFLMIVSKMNNELCRVNVFIVRLLFWIFLRCCWVFSSFNCAECCSSSWTFNFCQRTRNASPLIRNSLSLKQEK